MPDSAMRFRVGRHSPINIWLERDNEPDIQWAMARNDHMAAELANYASLGAWITQVAQDRPDTPLRVAMYAWQLSLDPELNATIEQIEREIADGTFDPGPGLDLDELRARYLPDGDE